MIERSALLDEKERNKNLILYSKAYSAPEVLEERFETVDEKADVYSVGVMAYEALLGRRPSRPANITASIEDDTGRLRSEINADAETIQAVKDVLAKLLSAEPGARPGAGEAAEQISKLSRKLEMPERSEPESEA
jgi:serine/threonine protein kinase